MMEKNNKRPLDDDNDERPCINAKKQKATLDRTALPTTSSKEATSLVNSCNNDQCSNISSKKLKAILDTTELPTTSTKETIGLANLCDDVIMHIFQYLSHDNLSKMALVCPTLSRISNDWTLWKNVRFNMFKKSMENIYMEYLKECTTQIAIKGNQVPSYDTSVSHKFIIQLETKCPELKHLSLYNQIFDAGEISVKILHRKLKTLIIENSIIENIPDSSSYLCGLNITCPDLEDIRMTFNDWFLPHCLYALAKLEKLTYLSLQGCNQFKDCIPYASITSVTGFKCLRTLDLRLTPISDHELTCFQRLKNLKHILLESPDYVNHDGDATITDMGVSGFCQNNDNNFNVDANFQYPYVEIWINRDGDVDLRRVDDRNNHYGKCKIENLYVRNYPRVTDTFLKNAASTCPFLKCLDVTGTSCTLDEVGRFKAQNPNVNIVC